MRRSPQLLAATCALVVLAATLRTAAAQSEAVEASRSVDQDRRSAIVAAAERTSPAVVSVSVVQTRLVRRTPFFSFFPDEFFQQYYPQFQYKEQLPGLGSGFIADASGIVITNEHVVRDADEIKVTLPDGREFPARIIDATRFYDLAFLKIDGEDLPIAPLGDSDALLVGEWAVAIGNPFGFLLDDPQPSVTAGVISATARDIKSDPRDQESALYLDMIQTDAAINPGNSGGPLVNALGEVIGINTFIFTRGGGSIGIGFAVPVNRMNRFLKEIREYGAIRQVWAGFFVQIITPYVAGQLGLEKPGGLIVTRVVSGSPADKASLRVGDVIRKVNGEKVETAQDFQRVLFGADVGDRAELEVEHAGDRRRLQLTFEENPEVRP
jgi:serine protease Do